MFGNVYLPPQENIELMFESISIQNKLNSVGSMGIFKVKYEMSTKGTKDKYKTNTKYESTSQNSCCYFGSLAPGGLCHSLKQT